ncbi:hypothetical protein [Dapis sp. BLCC M229]|uniref:hypothetical protein n=1 Tax=Dapis sp. BLCC M229 TaxID=3400188 RepID=UPI003CF1DF87
MKKCYILFGLTIGLITLIPLPVRAEKTETAEEIAKMVGAMTWCTNNVARNRSEESLYESAISAGNTKLYTANNQNDRSLEGLEKVVAETTKGKYDNKQLSQELCEEIRQKLLNVLNE